jgi:RND family efflux transporter MFP subunit
MKFGNIAAMILVTIFALAVMLASGTKLFTVEPVEAGADEPKPLESEAPVSVVRVSPERIEIVQRYSGMIRPLERMTLGFEIPGRIDKLGKNSNGQTFDDGVRVAAGDVIANLDSKELAARKAEADALLTQAKQEMDRAIAIRQKNKGAISEVDFLNTETTLRITEARAQLAHEQLLNATLVAPTDGIISKRFFLPGESINAHQPVFELLQVDEVLLVVGVPEAKIPPLLKRFKQVQRMREVGVIDSEPYKAYVQLVGRNTFGEPWRQLRGVVRTISEASDEMTGLFEVEIAISNQDGQLRPGQIAVARIVADEIDGFRLPSAAAIFEAGQGVVYYVTKRADGKSQASRHQLKPGAYLEQGDELILRDLPSKAQVVVRGQHRLTPGRLIRVIQGEATHSPVESAASDEATTTKAAGA